MTELRKSKMQSLLVIAATLLLISRKITAQSGYNYGSPELTVGGNNISPAGGAAVRPLVGGFPATAPAQFTSPVTAYTGGSVIPTSGFSSLPAAAAAVGANTATIFNPSGSVGVPSAAYSGTASSVTPKRPIALQQQQQQRPATGIFGNIVSGSQPSAQQFTNRVIGSGPGSNNDYTDGDYSAIPGTPGVDYPVYAEVPPTSFDCSQQPLPGYYSDVEAQCQVFHICALNRTYSFLCPNGTIFSQATLVCVWWNQYDCVSAPSLYANNAFIYDYGIQGNTLGSGYQTIGTGGSTLGSPRPATQNYPTATNSARASITPSASAAAIYGSANLRPTIPALPTGTGSTTVARYTPAATIPAASFATGSAVGASAIPFAATAVRSGEGYPTALQETAYPSAPIASKKSNREYLPPSRRQ